jgi:tetratricopeptide (TPR) repeat protein
LLTKALSESKIDALLFAIMGNKEECDLAIADYTKAIELRPDFAEAYNNRDEAYNRKTKAYNRKTKVLKEEESDQLPNVLCRLSCIARCYNGEFDLVIADCTKAIEQNPDHALTYDIRGNAYHTKGEYNLAMADFTKAIELEPDYAIAYRNRGEAYLDKGEYDLAIADFEKVLELEPNDNNARNLLAKARIGKA